MVNAFDQPENYLISGKEPLFFSNIANNEHFFEHFGYIHNQKKVLEFFFREYHMFSNGEKLERNCSFSFQILNHCKLTNDLIDYIKLWVNSTAGFDSYDLKLIFLKIIVSIYTGLKKPDFKNPINTLVDKLIIKDKSLFNLIKNHPVLNKINYSNPKINNSGDLIK